MCVQYYVSVCNNVRIFVYAGVLSDILNFVLEPPRREAALVPGAEGIVSIPQTNIEKHTMLYVHFFTRQS